MENILLTLLGVFIGGVISWVLAYEYWRKEHINKPVTASTYVTIELSPQKIWQIITSLDFDSYLDWRGIYHAPPYLHKEHQVSNGMCKRNIYFQKVSEPYELAWGGDPSKWDHRLTLQPMNKGTRICLERVFWPYISNWFDFILDGFDTRKGIMSHHSLVCCDIERIEYHICQLYGTKKD